MTIPTAIRLVGQGPAWSILLLGEKDNPQGRFPDALYAAIPVCRSRRRTSPSGRERMNIADIRQLYLLKLLLWRDQDRHLDRSRRIISSSPKKKEGLKMSKLISEKNDDIRIFRSSTERPK